MDRRGFLALAGVCCTLAGRDVFAAPAPGASLPVAINKAGRQRMLSQRLAKAWLQEAAGVQSDKGKQLLGQSMSLFEQQLQDLRGVVPNDDVKSRLVHLEQEWGRFRPLLGAVQSDPKAVWTANESVLTSADQLTKAYEQASGAHAAQVINLAGRQRMLSQRMAKAYLFRVMNVNVPQATEMLTQSVLEFSKAHDQLKASPLNTAQIKSELGLVEQQWFFFQTALGARTSEQQKAAADVASTSERILGQMDAVVSMYEKVAA
ncbi:type IV pili methyl-accepting chemotaxis transducer N-terminal domain-containing protein [Zoogloea sp.]|uniref:type IV pili methyl-accepting chemotaxis transducer N-terminal domain-containing protein n=1 Tax=Zoogloea sp. TaxID=49181 RepID=UPI0035B136A5